MGNAGSTQAGVTNELDSNEYGLGSYRVRGTDHDDAAAHVKPQRRGMELFKVDVKMGLGEADDALTVSVQRPLNDAKSWEDDND